MNEHETERDYAIARLRREREQVVRGVADAARERTAMEEDVAAGRAWALTAPFEDLASIATMDDYEAINDAQRAAMTRQPHLFHGHDPCASVTARRRSTTR